MKTSNLLGFAILAALAVAHSPSVQSGSVRHHRRHHARRDFDLASPLRERAVTSSRKCSSKSGKSSSSSKGKSSSSGSKSSGKKPSGKSSSGKTSSSSCPKGALQVKGVCIGMLPDGGSDGGSPNTMSQLNSLITSTGAKHYSFGQYAQAHPGFDGSQLLQVLDDLKESGSVFEPAVMPTAGWQGLTTSDDSLAREICTVMKKFTDEGIETWLRFAHEVNWYQTDGTYQGTADDFKEGWKAVANACKEIAPEVKMLFTPNMADITQLRAYYPDKDLVDGVGLDFYPKENLDNLDGVFLSAVKELHDDFCSDGSKTVFRMGETGIASGGTAQQKINWLKSMVDAKSELPALRSITWFNYVKSENGMSKIPFKIADPDDSDTTSAYLTYLSSS